MNQSQAYIQNQEYLDQYQEYYQQNPQQTSPVIEGYFPKEDITKEMSIRKINTILTLMLVLSIFATAISYYFATANEMVLNDLSRQTVVLNDENFDLQNKLDKLKSFNNVDMTMQKSNMLQKAQQVMEVTAVSSNTIANKRIDAQRPFSWSIGY